MKFSKLGLIDSMIMATGNYLPPTVDDIRIYRNKRDEAITITFIPSTHIFRCLIKKETKYLRELNLDMSDFTILTFKNQLQSIEDAINESIERRCHD